MRRILLLSSLLCSTASAGDWADRVHGDAAVVRASQPELARRVDEMKPVVNRAGGLFFPGSAWTEPDAQLLISDRLLQGGDPQNVRVALAYALTAEHRLPWSEISEQDEAVRVAMLGAYKKSGSTVLALALKDESLLVRAEAARLAGYQKDASVLTEPLMKLLAEPSVEVRRSVVRSLGWLEVKEAYPAIRRLLSDADAGLRQTSLRALDHIDSEQTRALPELVQLTSDPDPAVARKAAAIQR